MSTLREVRMPRTPECWDSCGACGSGDVFVLEIFVQPGDVVHRDDNILSLETGKVSLDIPTPYAGEVVELRVEVGDTLAEDQLILTLIEP